MHTAGGAHPSQGARGRTPRRCAGGWRAGRCWYLVSEAPSWGPLRPGSVCRARVCVCRLLRLSVCVCVCVAPGTCHPSGVRPCTRQRRLLPRPGRLGAGRHRGSHLPVTLAPAPSARKPPASVAASPLGNSGDQHVINHRAEGSATTSPAWNRPGRPAVAHRTFAPGGGRRRAAAHSGGHAGTAVPGH